MDLVLNCLRIWPWTALSSDGQICNGFGVEFLTNLTLETPRNERSDSMLKKHYVLKNIQKHNEMEGPRVRRPLTKIGLQCFLLQPLQIFSGAQVCHCCSSPRCWITWVASRFSMRFAWHFRMLRCVASPVARSPNTSPCYCCSRARFRILMSQI